MSLDIRWKQRLENFNKALAQLTSAVAIARRRPLSLLEKQGLIKSFEFTYELAWNIMKDYFANQANTSITGSRAMGNYREGSDIDLTIKSSTLTLSQRFQIENELDDLLLPYKIDLSIFSQIDNRHLIEHIQRAGKIFYQNPK